MPNYRVNKNNSRTNSRSNKNATTKDTKNDEDAMPSIVIKPSPPSSKKTTLKNTRAPFQEPPPASPPASPAAKQAQEPWVLAKMTKEEWEESRHRTKLMMERWRYEDIRNSLSDEWYSVDYWRERENILQKQRWYLTRRGPLSSDDIIRINDLDDEIWECEEHIQGLWEEDMWDQEERAYYEAELTAGAVAGDKMSNS